MTTFADGITSGLVAVTSALSSESPVQLCRTIRLTGGGNQTVTGMFPSGVENLDMKLFILAQGSAATSDVITLTASAGSTTLGTITAFGSAIGVLRNTTVALGTLNVIASAGVRLSKTQEVPWRVVLSSVDTATDYNLQLTFSRVLRN